MEPQLAIALVVLVMFPVFFGTLWCAVVFFLATIGGWRRLARTYATTVAPHGMEFAWLTGRVGLVPYRNILRAHVAPTGLFLSVPLPFRIGQPNLFIPWKDVHDRENVRALFRDVVRFRVGEPEIARIELPAAVLARATER